MDGVKALFGSARKSSSGRSSSKTGGGKSSPTSQRDLHNFATQVASEELEELTLHIEVLNGVKAAQTVQISTLATENITVMLERDAVRKEIIFI